MAPLHRYSTRLRAVGRGQPELDRGAGLLLEELLIYVSTFFHNTSRPQYRQLSRVRPAESLHGRRPSLPLPRHFSTLPPSSQTASCYATTQKRRFHNYFVTHLPQSSVHPDSRVSSHKLPRSASTPHTPGPDSSPAARPPNMPTRDLTVVRIPLRSAKHHFGAYNSRGSRSYNEDANQAGTIDMPAFAKRAPMSLSRSSLSEGRHLGEGINADSSKGDPQIFYFGVFDGHGGSECSQFLKDELHGYIEQAASDFDLHSSLKRRNDPGDTDADHEHNETQPVDAKALGHESGKEDKALRDMEMKSAEEVESEMQLPERNEAGVSEDLARMEPLKTDDPVPVKADLPRALQLQRELVKAYKDTVGGYFRRFKPAHFHLSESSFSHSHISVETVLNYAFLRADLDFITAQARKPDPDDPYVADFPLNNDEVLGSPHLPPSGQGIGGSARFKGGSTASVALISTPTPAPFWHPSARSTLLVAHVGDTRILLCETATGLPRPLTSDHHPSSPTESRRLRRFAESLITDSFGEERISGLANSRAFGDMQSKRIGVSAEPEITRTELAPAEYAFLVLMSDGVSGTLSDQEIVDVIKEAKTPEQGSKDVVEYATEISADGDNATCLVVRLGGWERRSEGGVGSLGTKEIRDARRAEALDPRRGRR